MKTNPEHIPADNSAARQKLRELKQETATQLEGLVATLTAYIGVLRLEACDISFVPITAEVEQAALEMAEAMEAVWEAYEATEEALMPRNEDGSPNEALIEEEMRAVEEQKQRGKEMN